MRGIIALDIDRTITVDTVTIPPDVVAYLMRLAERGWRIVIISGRTFAFSEMITRAFPFEYILACYNGALLLHMPSRQIIAQHYLGKEILPFIERISTEISTDCVVFGGYDHADRCYWRPHLFDEAEQHYLAKRRESHFEIWDSLEEWDKLPIERFPSVKFFGTWEHLLPIAERLEKELGLHIPVIGDPFKGEVFVAQATQGSVHKGSALLDVKRLYPTKGPVIAAGDDYNDITMLTAADIRVIMATAPKDLLAMAHVIAPPAKENGIIEGLEQALRQLGDL